MSKHVARIGKIHLSNSIIYKLDWVKTKWFELYYVRMRTLLSKNEAQLGKIHLCNSILSRFDHVSKQTNKIQYFTGKFRAIVVMSTMRHVAIYVLLSTSNLAMFHFGLTMPYCFFSNIIDFSNRYLLTLHITICDIYTWYTNN